jgi:hypothetical protein
MSSNKRDIEKIFSSAFDHYQHGLDQETVWQDIEERLNHKKKRRFLFWLWPAGILAVGLILVLFMPFNQDPTSQLPTPIEDSEKMAGDIVEHANESKQQSIANSPNVISEDILPNRPIEEEAANVSKIFNSNTKSATVDEKDGLVSNHKIADAKNIGENYSISESQYSPAITVPQQIFNVDQYELDEHNENAEGQQDFSRQHESSYENTRPFHERVSSNIQLADGNLWLKEIALLKLPLFIIAEPDFGVDFLPMIEQKSIRKKPNNNHYFIDVCAAGIRQFVTTNRNQLGEPGSNVYLADWKDSQQAIGGCGATVTVGKTFGRHLELGIGLRYQRFINKLQRDDEVQVERRAVWDEQAFYYFDDNNNQVFVGGNVIETEIRTSGVRAKQIHSVFSVPIYVGWSSYVGKTKLGLNAGPVVNIKHEFKGKVLSQNDDVIDIQNQDQQIYRSQLGISWAAALRASRSLGKQMELFTAVEFQYNPVNWLNDDQALKSKYQVLGVNVGVRRNF